MQTKRRSYYMSEEVMNAEGCGSGELLCLRCSCYEREERDAGLPDHIVSGPRIKKWLGKKTGGRNSSSWGWSSKITFPLNCWRNVRWRVCKSLPPFPYSLLRYSQTYTFLLGMLSLPYMRAEHLISGGSWGSAHGLSVSHHGVLTVNVHTRHVVSHLKHKHTTLPF